MANGKTTQTRNQAALADDREYEKLALSFQRLVHHDKKITTDLKILKWMMIFTLVVMIFLLFYFLYSVFTILGYF